MPRPILVEESPSFAPRSPIFLSMVAVALTLMTTVLGGCVSSEKYEAEKARALNFQRLLAQEEKRTGELNAKYQEVQRKASSLESQNRDVSTEMDALREQLNRTQEELTRARDGGGGAAQSKAEDLTLSEPSISEFGLEDIEFKDSDFSDFGSDLGDDMAGDLDAGSDTAMMGGGMAGGGGGSSHTVAKGETLYRISKQYGVSVQDLKDWNNLSGNIISIGQKLIVSSP